MGVSQKHEIETAISVLKESGCPEVVLLHCVSEYPAKPQDFCLKNMPQLKDDYGVEFGLSDHSIGHVVAVAATALGARVIEKHLCLDRNKSSVDGEFSMLPDEFHRMVNAVHMTHDSLSGNQLPQTSSVFKRSILVSSPVCEGDQLTYENIRIARPADGLCPSRWFEIVNSSFATRDMPVGHPLSEADFIVFK